MCAQDCAALGLQRVVREKEEKDIKQRGGGGGGRGGYVDVN